MQLPEQIIYQNNLYTKIHARPDALIGIYSCAVIYKFILKVGEEEAVETTYQKLKQLEALGYHVPWVGDLKVYNQQLWSFEEQQLVSSSYGDIFENEMNIFGCIQDTTIDLILDTYHQHFNSQLKTETNLDLQIFDRIIYNRIIERQIPKSSKLLKLYSRNSLSVCKLYQQFYLTTIPILIT